MDINAEIEHRCDTPGVAYLHVGSSINEVHFRSLQSAIPYDTLRVDAQVKNDKYLGMQLFHPRRPYVVNVKPALDHVVFPWWVTDDEEGISDVLRPVTPSTRCTIVQGISSS